MEHRIERQSTSSDRPSEIDEGSFFFNLLLYESRGAARLVGYGEVGELAQQNEQIGPGLTSGFNVFARRIDLERVSRSIAAVIGEVNVSHL